MVVSRFLVPDFARCQLCSPSTARIALLRCDESAPTHSRRLKNPICSSPAVAASARRLNFFADNTPQRLLEPRRLALNMLAQGIVDQCLVALPASGGVSLSKEVGDNVFVETDGDASFSVGLGLGRRNSPALARTEVVLLFHLFPSYWMR